MSSEKIFTTIIFIAMMLFLFWVLHWLDGQDDDKWPPLG